METVTLPHDFTAIKRYRYRVGRAGDRRDAELPHRDFGAAVRAARDERGLRQAAVAARLGVQPSLLSNIEAGRRRASDALLSKLADVLAVEVDSLRAARDDAERRWAGRGPDLIVATPGGPVTVDVKQSIASTKHQRRETLNRSLVWQALLADMADLTTADLRRIADFAAGLSAARRSG